MYNSPGAAADHNHGRDVDVYEPRGALDSHAAVDPVAVDAGAPRVASGGTDLKLVDPLRLELLLASGRERREGVAAPRCRADSVRLLRGAQWQCLDRPLARAKSIRSKHPLAAIDGDVMPLVVGSACLNGASPRVPGLALRSTLIGTGCGVRSFT